jgi:DNA-binding IclR family transcriptional regulator
VTRKPTWNRRGSNRGSSFWKIVLASNRALNMLEPHPLHEEIRCLAEQVAAVDNEDVIDSAASIAAWYRRERFVALGLAAVDSMVSNEPEQIDENDPRLVAVRQRLRDRLKALLAWARETGRL